MNVCESRWAVLNCVDSTGLVPRTGEVNRTAAEGDEKRMATRFQIVAAATLLSAFWLAGQTRGADVISYVVAGKSQEWIQTDAGPPRWKSATPYRFMSSVDLTAPGTVNTATVHLPDGSERDLVPRSGGSTFRYDKYFSSQAELNAEYPDGAYTLTIDAVRDGTQEISLRLEGDQYPNAPQITNWASLQVANAASDVVIAWDTFASGRTNDLIHLLIETDPIWTVALPGPHTSVAIPAGTLSPGQTYYASLLFARRLESATAAYPGAVGSTVYWMETSFNITTLPETRPRITAIEKIGADIVFRFTTLQGSRYSVEKCDELGSGTWDPLTSNLVGTGAIVTVTDFGVAALPQRYYRVASQP